MGKLTEQRGEGRQIGESAGPPSHLYVLPSVPSVRGRTLPQGVWGATRQILGTLRRGGLGVRPTCCRQGWRYSSSVQIEASHSRGRLASGFHGLSAPRFFGPGRTPLSCPGESYVESQRKRSVTMPPPMSRT